MSKSKLVVLSTVLATFSLPAFADTTSVVKEETIPSWITITVDEEVEARRRGSW